MRTFAIAFVAMICATPARAAPGDVESAAPENVEVTVYREDASIETADLTDYSSEIGLVMVRETRTIDLPAGASRILFLNVADRILPQSAAIEGLPSGVIERNFDYDLMSPGTIVEKSVGAPVKLVRTNPRTGAETIVDATIRTGPDGVLLDIAGRLEALHCSGLPERLVFERIPDTLASKPTLSAQVKAPQAGRYQIQLSYLATGLLWSADYVARIAPDGRTIALSSWVTLANKSETTFAGAPTEVVAGRLARVDHDSNEPSARGVAPRCWPIQSARGRLPPPPPSMMAAIAPEIPLIQNSPIAIGDVVVTASRIEARDLGDVKLYSLPLPTTLAANQIKQVQFIDQPRVKVERLYRYELPTRGAPDESDEPERTTRVLRFKNDSTSGLGLALPQGRLAAYEQTRDGDVLFTGAGAVDDVPVGSPFDVTLGLANDVTIQTIRVNKKAVADTETRFTVELELTNGKTSPVTVELAMLPEEGVRIVHEGKHNRMREGYMTWQFTLAASERQTFRYAASVKD